MLRKANGCHRLSRHVLTMGATALALLLLGVPVAHAQFRDVTPRPEPEPVAPTPEPITEIEPQPIPEPERDAASSTPAAPLEQELLEELIDDTEIRPLRFRGVTVGETTEEELQELWGEPFKILKGKDTRILKYRTKPFRQVDVTITNDVVSTLLMHLDGVLEPAHCAAELRMTQIDPVPVPDEEGQVIGLAYPERGVLFGFDRQDPEALVSKIQLEPINPEPFLLRAEYDFENRFEADLEDIEIALEMNPRFARAHHVRATVLRDVGRFHDALDAASKAVHFNPDVIGYRLTKAELLARNGNYDMAVREIKTILEQSALADEVRAHAEQQLGDMIAASQPGQFKKAMQHHLKAIEIAATLANDQRFQVRRLAKQVLFNAHLAVARDISLGEFQKQNEVVPKWLSRARAIVDESIERDQGDRVQRLKVYSTILASAADLRNPDDPARVIEELIDEGRRQIAHADDPLQQSRIEWWLGQGLAEAVRLQRLRGDDVAALQLADEAQVLLQESAKRRQSTAEQTYLVGRLYFHVGSLYAVQRSDHDEAIRWYEKAEPLLAEERPAAILADPGTHGEMFVSMGVSYWEKGNQSKALELTEFGTDVLQRAVVDGTLEAETLAIPYGNLARMHGEHGNQDEAKAFAELASSIAKESEKKTRR